MRQKKLILLAALLTFIMIVVMQFYGTPLKTSLTPKGIIDLEFAGTVEHGKAIYTEWQPVLHVAINHTLLDFLFIVFYTFLFYKVVRLLANRFNNSWRRVGIWMSRAAIVAGSFDIIENLLLIRMLHNHISREIVASTFMFAAGKFMLLAFALLYMVFVPYYQTYDSNPSRVNVNRYVKRLATISNRTSRSRSFNFHCPFQSLVIARCFGVAHFCAGFQHQQKIKSPYCE